MKNVLIGMTMALSLSLHAQTAKVIPLTSAEAAEAKSLHEQQKAIADKLDALEKRIQTEHLLDKSSEIRTLGGSKTFNWLAGWDFGTFEYSEDFRFIVPSRKGSFQAQPLYGPPVSPYATCCNVVLGGPATCCAIAN